MAEEARTVEVELPNSLSDQEKALVRAYATSSSPTYKRRQASMLAVGYTKSTTRAKSGVIFRRPRVIEAINRLCLKEARVSGFEGETITAIKNFLKQALDFNVLDCFEVVEYKVLGADGKTVVRRELQVRELVGAGIDGRLFESMKVTNSKVGQTIEFKPVGKLQSARLLAGMEGALEEGANKTENNTLVIQNFGEPIDPREVNDFESFRQKYLTPPAGGA